jgi:hypothetical protein
MFKDENYILENDVYPILFTELLGENYSGLIFEKIKKEMILNEKPLQLSFAVEELNFQKFYEKDKLAENFSEIMRFLENIPLIQGKKCEKKKK